MIMTKFLDPRGNETERNPKPSEEIEIKEERLFGESDNRSVRIKKNLPSKFKEKLVALLRNYHKCFAWFATNMPDINPKIACHKLAIDPNFKLI